MHLVVDIDNTLWDSQTCLAKRDSGFDPTVQVQYSYFNKNLLEFYGKTDFYLGDDYNLLVVRLVRNFLERGHSVTFISDSPSEEVHKAKLNMLRRVFNTNGLGLINVPWGAEREFIASCSTDTVFVDDAPHRIKEIVELGYKVIVVEHPYNKEFHNGSELVPNYLLNGYQTLRLKKLLGYL